ncbi:MAG: GNAT family N-acetyltransferase [Clostridiales bacterium]|nr:GNAT family N-acetyltransferase [Clostridiales bacterium]
MLRNILFVIGELDHYEQLAETIMALAAEWTGSAACFVRVALEKEYPACLMEWHMEINDTIVVTDRAELARKAAAKSQAVVAVLTEKNRNASFGGVMFAIEGIQNPGMDYFEKVYGRCHGIPWTILETDRCLVREIQLEDLDRLYEIYAEPSITQYMEGLYEDRAEEEQYTRDYIRNMYGFYGYGMWVVEEKKSHRLIGRAGIESGDSEETAELGYLIAKEYQRQGYATEVCEAIIKYAGDKLEFKRIVCYVEPENEASRMLCRRLGLTEREEKVRKGKRYCFYEKEFMKEFS